MYTEMALRKEGMKTLIDHLGKVDAEKFISLIIREPFDYTEWQKNLFSDLSVKELSNLAMKEYKASNSTSTSSDKN
jgi:hypothetical protein